MRRDSYALGPCRARQLLLLAGSLFLGSCLVFPTISDSRKNIDKDTAASLQAGVTTKEDVLLQLGEPDFVSEDERQLNYVWTGPGVVFIGLSGSSSVSEKIGDYDYTLLLTFSADDVLERTDVSTADGHVTENY